MRNYAGLTDHDFELLIADLFGAEEGWRYEVFARGRDLGVDLRRTGTRSAPDVVQCKHFLQSTVPQLRSAARAEARKLKLLAPPVARYRFVTSHALTDLNKQQLVEDLAPFLASTDDVWGADDLELLIGRHPEVEERHIKLWLPSHPQLQAVVHSAIHARSRELVEEIQTTLARWVPSDAFRLAREVLRKERVCVIAGIPGIGKTTLARMLVADAMTEGYTPIHVSEDIEEAWALFRPDRKQVFYYDDFLGRTALTSQLGKNEEDRLLRFLRVAARSKTTRIILTTREYILQQAHDLYEHFGREDGPEHKFLLELKHYSRLDKARIFYNHAFVSGALTHEARAALLKGRAYQKIIDHPAYNPRQIEWITGLSGHRLTAEDNSNYVTFAVSALNDPERIWRHAFERQLSAQQRALLITLAALPDTVELNDLRTAFLTFCKVGRVRATPLDFERTLKVLDNSFVGNQLEGNNVFVSFQNPGIEDFVASVLRESPDDAAVLLRAAVTFEQVEKSARLLSLPERASPDLLDQFINSANRCLTSGTFEWHDVYVGRDAKKPTKFRGGRGFESRLRFLTRVPSWASLARAPALKAKVDELRDKAIAELRVRWSLGSWDRHAASGLLQHLKVIGLLPDDLVEAAKGLYADDLQVPYDFSLLAQFRGAWPEVFDPAEWSSFQDRFEEVATEALTDAKDMESVEEVEEMAAFGRAMEVELDRDMLREAQTIVEERAAEATQRAYEASGDDRPFVPEPAPARSDDESEIAELFARLAER